MITNGPRTTGLDVDLSSVCVIEVHSFVSVVLRVQRLSAIDLEVVVHVGMIAVITMKEFL